MTDEKPDQPKTEKPMDEDGKASEAPRSIEEALERHTEKALEDLDNRIEDEHDTDLARHHSRRTNRPPEPEAVPIPAGEDLPVLEAEEVDVEQSIGGRMQPWGKWVAVPTIGAVIIGGSMFLLDGGESGEDSEAPPPSAAQEQPEPEPDQQSSADGVTELEVIPCRSDTDGCDDEGDVQIDGSTSEEMARGADIRSVAKGYDPTSGEHQIQVAVGGSGAAVSGSPTVESYFVTIELDTEDGLRTVLLEWQFGQLSRTAFSVDGGLSQAHNDITAEWLNDGLLWVTLIDPSIPAVVETTNVTIQADVPNTDGSDTTTVSDEGSS